MPILAAFVGTLFTGLTSFLGLFFAQQIAGRIALVTLIAVGSAALMVALAAIAPSLSMPSIATTGFHLINGAALSVCITGMILCEAAISAHLFTLRVTNAVAGG